MTGNPPVQAAGPPGRRFPVSGRLQQRIRDAIVPLDEVARAVPSHGRVLEVGCGEGLLLKRLAGRSELLVGIDIDERKIGIAGQTLARSLNVRLQVQEAFSFLAGTADGCFSTALLADTLSSFAPDQQVPLLRELFRVVEPGGLLVVKAIDGQVRWKTALSRLLSGLVYRVLKLSLSEGQRFTYMSSGDLKAALEALGGEVAVRHLHRERFHPIPHILVLAAKRPAGPP